VNLVQDNNVEDIHVTAHDIRRAFDIYGKPFESVRGTTRRPTPRLSSDVPKRQLR
jgi:hypothetical protein